MHFHLYYWPTLHHDSNSCLIKNVMLKYCKRWNNTMVLSLQTVYGSVGDRLNQSQTNTEYTSKIAKMGKTCNKNRSKNTSTFARHTISHEHLVKQQCPLLVWWCMNFLDKGHSAKSAWCVFQHTQQKSHIEVQSPQTSKTVLINLLTATQCYIIHLLMLFN